MTLDHIAIWTNQLENLRDYYTKYFHGKASEKYMNHKTSFQSYFISFDSGARLEIMSKPDIQKNNNDTEHHQYLGIIHLAFGVNTMQEVDYKAAELKNNGFQILRGPRKTGDGYYEFETLDPDSNRIEVTTTYI
jgi:lactoylglutathione lyase